MFCTLALHKMRAPPHPGWNGTRDAGSLTTHEPRTSKLTLPKMMIWVWRAGVWNGLRSSINASRNTVDATGLNVPSATFSAPDLTTFA